MSTATVCKKCNGVGSYKLNCLGEMTVHCHDCNGVGKIEQSISGKGYTAAIATLQHLGYEYNGGEQWKPVKRTSQQKMCDLQRESNFRMSVQLENAALAPTKTWDAKPSITYSRLKDEIIKEYLAAQISELK